MEFKKIMLFKIDGHLNWNKSFETKESFMYTSYQFWWMFLFINKYLFSCIRNMHTHKTGALPWWFLFANDLSIIRAKILINPIQFWMSGDFINYHRIHSHWLFPGMEHLSLISFACAYINMKGIDVSSEEFFHSPTKRSNMFPLTPIH